MLSLSTIEEAQAAVGGRNLTTAEALWFRHTATVPDSWLYYMNVPYLFIIFNLAPLPALVMDALARSLFPSLRRFKLQPSSFVPFSFVLHCYKSVMTVFLLVVGPLQICSYPLIKFVGIRTSLPLPSIWEILAQLTVYFIIEDYGNYWIHRWLHSEWGYNNIHYKHHEFVAPTSVAAPYAHWLEILLLGFPSFVGPALVPCHMVTFWLWIALRQIEAIDTHSGYDFPWVPTKLIPFYGGSEYHDYHHFVGAKSQSNFASVFTYCDYIYGTDKGYRYKRRVEASRKVQ
ncbi:hypothetical protein KP509_13G035600 [Ceratopteris richardii]|uniref:Fatty acid hydroxylase domain-containing protein n=1 Tax=Ceratopteris richardii TaxID=49495 RepID=A0A8T2TEN3_CERRI|nr:hypothetical protein KP509_13G035600 [Ceratopteris richardii]